MNRIEPSKFSEISCSFWKNRKLWIITLSFSIQKFFYSIKLHSCWFMLVTFLETISSSPYNSNSFLIEFFCIFLVDCSGHKIPLKNNIMSTSLYSPDVRRKHIHRCYQQFYLCKSWNFSKIFVCNIITNSEQSSLKFNVILVRISFLRQWWID